MGGKKETVSIKSPPCFLYAALVSFLSLALTDTQTRTQPQPKLLYTCRKQAWYPVLPWASRPLEYVLNREGAGWDEGRASESKARALTPLNTQSLQPLPSHHLSFHPYCGACQMSLHHRTLEKGGEEKWTGTERRKVEGERKCVCVRERKRKRGGKWTWEKDGAGWTETECRLWGRFERTDTGVSDWRRAAPF